MVDGIVHHFVNPKSDGGDATITRPSDWNHDHDVNYIAPVGLTGATAASRYVGATASGAPASGTFATGDFVIDQTGKVWVCTAGGTSGTWAQIGSGGSLEVKEADGSPDVTGVSLIIVSNGTLTDNGGGSVSITTGGGGGGGVTTPVILDRASGGTTLTLGSTHPSGTRFLLAFNGSNNSLTSIAQTNVTWSSALITQTSTGGAHYELWVGIATGTSGTSVVLTTSSAFTSACVGAISDALTPTLGANVKSIKPGSATFYGDFQLSGATAGHLVAMLAGNDNTSVNNWLMPMIPCATIDNNPTGAGEGHGISLLVGYAPTGDVWFSLGFNSAPGVGIIAEIT